MSQYLIYRDALMLVINKPAGLAMHASSGKQKDAMKEILKELSFGLPHTPELAHRLDSPTTGCLLLGRHRSSLARLGELFKTNQIKKKYYAVVTGSPKSVTGTIDLPLAQKNFGNKSWWMTVDQENGQSAITHYEVLCQSKDRKLSLLELSPETGRTHQLRVHCQAMGFPILGDQVYGKGSKIITPVLHLHSRSIEIPYFENKEPVFVEAPLPSHFLQTLKIFQFLPIENDTPSTSTPTSSASPAS